MRRTRRAALGLVAAVVVAAAGVAAVVARDPAGRAQGEALPTCESLDGRRLGAFDVDPAWGGCRTSTGAAARSWRYDCLRASDGPPGTPGSDPPASPDMDDAPAGAVVRVVAIPDASVAAAEGGAWTRRDVRAPWAQSPFAVVDAAVRCEVLAALAHEELVVPRCDLDDVAVTLYTTQGCEGEDGRHRAVGRVCRYLDGDSGSSWEQWWIEDLELDLDPSEPLPIVLETVPGSWQLTRADGHRDDRCATPPGAWDAAWRGG